MALDFSYNGRTAGYFVDIPTYPTDVGQYHYMPYRSVGHYELAMAWREKGAARCTFTTAEGEVIFFTRYGDAPGVLRVEAFSAAGS